MKYSILGFSQEVVLSFKKEVLNGGKTTFQKLDVTDLLILKTIAGMIHRPKFLKVLINGNMFTNVHYSAILEDLPILDINKRSLAVRLDKLCDFGLVEKQIVKAQGNFTYFRVTDIYSTLLYNDTPMSVEQRTYDVETTKVCPQNDKGMSVDQQTKDSFTNPSTNLISNNNNKSEASSQSLSVKFDFCSELIKIGISEQVAKDWMQVRKQKKASNSETAYKMLLTELKKAYAAGVSPEECIMQAVASSWKGFKYEWITNNNNGKANNGNNQGYEPYNGESKADREYREYHENRIKNDLARIVDGFRNGEVQSEQPSEDGLPF